VIKTEIRNSNPPVEPDELEAILNRMDTDIKIGVANGICEVFQKNWIGRWQLFRVGCRYCHRTGFSQLIFGLMKFETGDILVNSGFTIAYPYISNEYYEGETPTSEQPAPEAQPNIGQPASETSSAPATSAPDFSLVTAIMALALVFFKFSRH
jgi:hypothetical protein